MCGTAKDGSAISCYTVVGVAAVET